jgi:hypothetical protein
MEMRKPARNKKMDFEWLGTPFLIRMQPEERQRLCGQSHILNRAFRFCSRYPGDGGVAWRLGAACHRGISIGAASYRSIVGYHVEVQGHFYSVPSRTHRSSRPASSKAFLPDTTPTPIPSRTAISGAATTTDQQGDLLLSKHTHGRLAVLGLAGMARPSMISVLIRRQPLDAPRTAYGDTRPENHTRGNARVRCARPVGLLCRLQVQPRDENERRQMARLYSFVGS